MFCAKQGGTAGNPVPAALSCMDGILVISSQWLVVGKMIFP